MNVPLNRTDAADAFSGESADGAPADYVETLSQGPWR